MKNEIIIDGEVYIKKSSITNVVVDIQDTTIGEKEEYKIGDIVDYNNYDWYIIDIKEDNYTLLMKERMSKKLIQELFTDERMLDDDFDVRFNRNLKNIWWSDSYIRQVLNTKFLEKFNVNELNEMETTVTLDEEEDISKDYIRLITKEECDKLDEDILEVSDRYGYWTMSPFCFGGTVAIEWIVWSTGYMRGHGVSNGYGVRPVINLKSEYFLSKED